MYSTFSTVGSRNGTYSSLIAHINRDNYSEHRTTHKYRAQSQDYFVKLLRAL